MLKERWKLTPADSPADLSMSALCDTTQTMENVFVDRQLVV
eukprot:COSAG01_NODE_5320_length_4335_cov_8.874646_1_plen_41_part_00